MYDEINNDPIEVENHESIEPEPVEEVVTQSETAEEQAERDTAAEEAAANQEEPQTSSSFYHYTYDRTSSQNTAQGQNGNYRQPTPMTGGGGAGGNGGNGPGTYYEIPTPGKPKKNGGGFGKKVAVAASLALVFGVVSSAAFQITDYVGGKVAPKETEARIETTGNNTEAGVTQVKSEITSDVAQTAKDVMPSIVAITNKSVQTVRDMFFGTQYEQEAESTGSGVIISQSDSELLIASNNHVVAGAETLTVCFTVDAENADDLVVEAQIKGTSPDYDLAIIAVDLADISDEVKGKIKVAEIGSSDDLQVGQQAIAIGNALGYGQSLTVGYISALDREVSVDEVTGSYIQTDAAINPGNSGGALLNSTGQLIGINSVKASATGVEGMGYAIPIDTAMPIFQELMSMTTRTQVEASEMGYMGITVSNVSEEARQIYSMPAGAFVSGVSEDSAAAEAGIVKGDIITKFDGITITSRDELLNRMQYYKAGEQVDVIVNSLETGEYVERTVTLTLGERPADADTTQQSESTENQDEGQDMWGQEESRPQEGFFGYQE